jgi:hypothetical protein
MVVSGESPPLLGRSDFQVYRGSSIRFRIVRPLAAVRQTWSTHEVLKRDLINILMNVALIIMTSRVAVKQLDSGGGSAYNPCISF